MNLKRLMEEAEGLSPEQLAEVADFMGYLKNKTQRPTEALPRILAQALIDDEPTTPQEEAEVEEARQQARRGEVISAEDLKRKYRLV